MYIFVGLVLWLVSLFSSSVADTLSMVIRVVQAINWALILEGHISDIKWTLSSNNVRIRELEPQSASKT